MQLSLLRTLFLTAIGLLIIVGCDLIDSSDESASQEDVLMPIAEGNAWEYESTIPDDRGGALAATGATRTIDGRVFDEVNGGLFFGFLYVHQDEEGLYFSAEEGDIEEIDMFFRYPIEDGANYVHTNVYGSFPVTVSESSIIVPAGNFETIAYEIGGDVEDDLVIHFSADIGPVALVGIDESGNEIWRFQLVSYDVR